MTCLSKCDTYFLMWSADNPGRGILAFGIANDFKMPNCKHLESLELITHNGEAGGSSAWELTAKGRALAEKRRREEAGCS